LATSSKIPIGKKKKHPLHKGSQEKKKGKKKSSDYFLITHAI